MPPPRMTANPVKPARYRPGKGREEELSSEEEQDEAGAKIEELSSRQKKAVADPKRITKNIQNVILEDRRAQAAAAEVARLEAEKAKEEEDFETEESSIDGSDEEESEESEENTSEDKSSEDEAPRILLRPTFLRKDKRQDSSAATEARAEEGKWAENGALRKAKADEIIQEQLERNAASRALGRRNWDDDEEEEADAVDDTDGLDPDAELAAWKLRELRRVKREREAIETAERERDEIERRRNLVSEEREAEDAAFIARQKGEQMNRGKLSYMQKYFHKGAFFQDDLKEQGIDRRDIMASKFEDQTDRTLLPEYMQIRDMTKLGKKGRTKYRDMKSEDTGKWGMYEKKRGQDQVGADVRFMPDRPFGGERIGPSGANATQIREPRKAQGDILMGRETNDKGQDSNSTVKPPRQSNRDTQNAKLWPSSYSKSRSRSHSRSRSETSQSLSPRHSQSNHSRGPSKRNLSPRFHQDGDKRRRLHAR